MKFKNIFGSSSIGWSIFMIHYYYVGVTAQMYGGEASTSSSVTGTGHAGSLTSVSVLMDLTDNAISNYVNRLISAEDYNPHSCSPCCFTSRDKKKEEEEEEDQQLQEEPLPPLKQHRHPHPFCDNTDSSKTIHFCRFVKNHILVKDKYLHNAKSQMLTTVFEQWSLENIAVKNKCVIKRLETPSPPSEETRRTVRVRTRVLECYHNGHQNEGINYKFYIFDGIEDDTVHVTVPSSEKPGYIEILYKLRNFPYNDPRKFIRQGVIAVYPGESCVAQTSRGTPPSSTQTTPSRNIQMTAQRQRAPAQDRRGSTRRTRGST